MYGYIKQYDEENDQDIIYLLDNVIFDRMKRALRIDSRAELIEVVSGELIGGVSYNFTMKDGTKFLMAGDAFVSIIVPVKEKELPDLGYITTAILEHMHINDSVYSIDILVDVAQANSINKSREQVTNIISSMAQEKYIYTEGERVMLTELGQEIARVLVEGRRKKGSPAPLPKKEEAPSPLAPVEIYHPEADFEDIETKGLTHAEDWDKKEPDPKGDLERGLDRDPFKQTSDETHKAIMTILNKAKLDGEPVTSLVQMGIEAGYLAREVVQTIREGWPELLRNITSDKSVICLACTFPMPSIKEGCPGCGSVDHMPEYLLEATKVFDEIDIQRATEVEEIQPKDLEAAADMHDKLEKVARENLPEAIMRIANTLDEPFQRGDILQVLKKEILWGHIDLTAIAREVGELVDDEAQLFHDGKGFRVTVRDPVKEKDGCKCKGCVPGDELLSRVFNYINTNRPDTTPISNLAEKFADEFTVQQYKDFLQGCFNRRQLEKFHNDVKLTKEGLGYIDIGTCDECGAEHPIARGGNFGVDPRDDEKWLCNDCFEKIACGVCNGSGESEHGPGSGYTKCADCGGTGEKQTDGLTAYCHKCDTAQRYDSSSAAHEDGWWFDTEKGKWFCYNCDTPKKKPAKAEKKSLAKKAVEEAIEEKKSLSDMADMF